MGLTDGPIAAQADDQAEIEDEEEIVSVLTPYGSDVGTIAQNAQSKERSYTPPSKSPQDSNPTLWTPIWLSRATLIAFAVTFLLMLLTTALLYHFSEQNNGISAQREANHYAWKYGPTAGKTQTPLTGERILYFRPLTIRLT
jgi:hypothetical protein